MSYILEALKKSQQERELGQVPTLDASALFTEDKEPVPTNHWALLAVGLACLAVVIALYAAFRVVEPPSEPPEPVSEPLMGETALPRMPVAPRPMWPETTPSGLEVAPLIEAPPPKRLPRPVAPDTQEPIQFTDQEPRVESVDPPVSTEFDPDLELDLLRQLESEQAAINATREVLGDPPPRVAPVPSDLIQDIEAFKQQVRREQGIPPPESKRTPARISGDPTRLKLTPEQQAMVPGYLMTVHVFDADVAKRFVVINTLRYREGEETREGLRVEQILKDGAVLSYLGNPFYVPR
ncbi:general secretion pathway protein GspB [Thiocystis violacea]|uniref:general secretion pathway protein GspB n=1 Tax=Thiocystis violacea TaxID=13725 RepID=UPI00190646D1|nr:general secretion pathway protein GspB [Thiocystis violacea]MBK1719328.1 hypothetical protein [Thiocystis violacea]